MRPARWAVAAALAPFAIFILWRGRDSGPAVGPGGRGFHGPRMLSFGVAGIGRLAGQGAWARAVMRSKAVTMSSAQGQLAWIFSCRPRAPRVIRAAACRMRPVNRTHLSSRRSQAHQRATHANPGVPGAPFGRSQTYQR